MSSKNNFYQQQFKEKLLVNRYQLIEMVGEGAMGQVYRAEDRLSNNSNVAVKILAKALDDSKMIKRFQREATISALLSERCNNIVKVTDYGLDENKVPFYVMEFLNGQNLTDIIQYHDLPLVKILSLTRQICLAMEEAHNGIFFEGEVCPIIHRDLKPSNVFIIEDSHSQEIVKVLDFGIAKLMQPQGEKTENFMGTPKYCSPEQIQGKDLDNRSDVYSLGLLMYEMLTKKMPWELKNDSVGEWYTAHTELLPEPLPDNLNIPQELQSLVMRCLAKSPSDRPQNVGEIIQVIDGITRSLQPKAKPKQIITPELDFPDLSIPTSSNAFIDNSAISQKSFSPLEQHYLQLPWPDSKPQQKIVFPRVTTFENGIYPSLWVMLEEEEIEKRKNNTRYNKFMFQSYPHPMILWVTVLYSLEDDAKWLPCYLDLKAGSGYPVAKCLADSTQYYILFFALNKPAKCQHIMKMKILLKQRTPLKQWTSLASRLDFKELNQAPAAKKRLKQDFEAEKTKIIMELQKATTQEIHG
jgi:serine/threonine-protein kinase